MSSNTNAAIGIDIGGSNIKAALVDTSTGTLLGEIHSIETPADSAPKNLVHTCQKLVELIESVHFAQPAHSIENSCTLQTAQTCQTLQSLQTSETTDNLSDTVSGLANVEIPIGIAFPGPLPDGEVTFMAHLSQQWIGVNLNQFFSAHLERKTWVLNDADAAGLAEATHGAARNVSGSVFVATLGTGIGTALIHNGVLFPNTELGHIEIDGVDAETQAAASQRVRQNLSWEQWIARLQRYLSEIEKLFWPQIIVLGGGISANHEKFLSKLHTRARIVPAKLQNTAGIIGAAHWAMLHARSKSHTN